MTVATRALLLITLLAPSVLAQPLLPLQPVGFRDHVFVNSTGSGTPMIPCKVWYPALHMGPDAPMTPPPIGGYPVVVFLHGRCANAQLYQHLPMAFATQGFLVILEDSSGCLEDVQRDDAIALYQLLPQENQDPASFLHQAMNVQRVGVAGHSQGAGNVGRLLASNPGFETGVAFGIWNGPNASNWQLTSAAQIQTPMLLIHGTGDSVSPWQTTAMAWWNLMSAGSGVHVLHLFDATVDHFSIALPAWPGHGTGLDFVIFVRSMEVAANWFRRWLNEESASLEYVVGASAHAATFVDQIMVKVGEPQLWSDVVPATGQTHCLNVLSSPGFAGIYVATAGAQISTPIGPVLIDPLTAIPLIEGPPGTDQLLALCIPMPSNPLLIGSYFIHQALGTNESGSLLLSHAVDFTIQN